MQELRIVCGLPGSGKSTHAKQWKSQDAARRYVVSTDGLRLALNANIYPRKTNGDYQVLEPIVWLLTRQAVGELLLAGQDVAVDATHLTREQRQQWREFSRRMSQPVRFIIVWCEGAWDSADRWNRERGHAPAEYEMIRGELRQKIEVPSPDEADEVLFPGRPAGTPA